MGRYPDPVVELIDNQILLLKKEGLTYKKIAVKLDITDSRCRLAGKRTRRREYLKKYLREYRTSNPEFYERLKQKVRDYYRRKIRTDYQFRLQRNRRSKVYRKSLFGKRRLKTYSDICKAFIHPNEILSTKTLVERLEKPSYYHFYSQLKSAINKGVIKRISWGRYRIITKLDKREKAHY